MVRAAIVGMAIVAVAGRASAIPTGFYNAATGDLSVSNDAGFKLDVSLFTTADLTTNLAAFIVPPGSSLIKGSLPDFVIFLNFPEGVYDLGAIVVPHTPIDQLSSVWYPITHDTVAMFLPIVAVPEPGCAALAMVGIVAGMAVRRGRRRPAVEEGRL